MHTRECSGEGVSNGFDNAIAVQTRETFHKCEKAVPSLARNETSRVERLLRKSSCDSGVPLVNMGQPV